MLLKHRPPGMSLTILRPSIVGSSYRDPFPGWIDNLISSAALFFYSGIGLVKVVKCDGNLVSCNIPVDFVADHVIVSGALLANSGKFEVLHIGSSARNPVTMGLCEQCVNEYWNQNVPKLKVSKCNVTLQKSELQYNVLSMTRAVPALAFRGVAKILRNPKMKKDSQRWMKLLEKAHLISETFSHFNCHEWIFDAGKT